MIDDVAEEGDEADGIEEAALAAAAALDEEDWEAWAKFTAKVGDKIQIVGDDLHPLRRPTPRSRRRACPPGRRSDRPGRWRTHR